MLQLHTLKVCLFGFLYLSVPPASVYIPMCTFLHQCTSLPHVSPPLCTFLPLCTLCPVYMPVPVYPLPHFTSCHVHPAPVYIPTSAYIPPSLPQCTFLSLFTPCSFVHPHPCVENRTFRANLSISGECTTLEIIINSYHAIPFRNRRDNFTAS